MSFRFPIGSVTLVLVLLSGNLAAQTEFADTLSSEKLYELSLEALENKGWKRAREAMKKWLEREEATAEVLVMLGKAQLNLKDEKDAEKSFKKALEKDEQNMDALLGLCEVYLIRNKEKNMLNTLEQIGELEPESRKLLYYRALAADRFELEEYGESYFWDTLEGLVKTAPDEMGTLNILCDAYINDRFLERGILFLTEMQDLHGERSEIMFQLARIYTHTGDEDLARDLFAQIEEAGIDNLTPRQRVMMAQELFTLENDNLACEAYFSAARVMDDNLALEMFQDLRDLTTSDQRREFELTPTGRKGIFLISFWGRKDPTPTTVRNERLVEHYRRLRYVRKEYYSALRPGYDERGRVYIKHGEPDQKTSLSGNWAIRDNISWLYSKNRSNPLMYHFVSRVNYYRMAYSLEEALIPDIESEMSMGGRNVEELFRSRAEIHPKYDQLANEVHNFQGGSFEYARRTYLQDLFHDELLLTERGFTEGEVTETYEHEFEEEPMNFYYFPVSLKGPDTLSALGVYFGLPTDQIKVPDPFGTVEVPVELEVVLYDSWWQEVQRTTVSKTYRVPNFIPSRDAMIPDLLSMQIAPGYYHMAARLKQTRTNLMQIYKSNFYVDSYRSEDSLSLSDLILATSVVEDNQPSKFNLRGHRITPLPSSSFKSDMPVYVYYELYNLVPDSTGTKHIKVDYLVSSSSRDLSTARRIINTLGRFIGVRNEVGKVVTTFEHDISRPGNIDPIYISIDASAYVDGQYNLLVTTEDMVSGQVSTKDVTFIISK
ncbi:MAG: GWxTD domain-containing protein [Candidatus Glassbacteria bacterium]|nr:GWxTD domain-containing protein [Candidatus Glassbacteria bacterium]